MSVVLAWFDQRPTAARVEAHGVRRGRLAAAVAGLTTAGYRPHDSGGPDWGIVVRQAPAPGPWPVCAAGDGLTAVSLGLPVGLDTTGGPLGVARRLLAGADLAAHAVPPFGMLVRAADDSVLVAQDWLGMCRLYTAAHDGIVAFASRASLLAAFLYGTPAPDVEGWESCAAGGRFGGDSAPVRGVRLLGPAARVRLRRAAEGWRADWRAGRGVDDLVRAGLSRRGDPERAVAAAADALAAAVTAAADLCGDALTLALGADAYDRAVAAACVAAGRLPAVRARPGGAGQARVVGRLLASLDQRGECADQRRGQARVVGRLPASLPEAVSGRPGGPAADRRGAALGPPAHPDPAPEGGAAGAGLRERALRLLRHFDFQVPAARLAGTEDGAPAGGWSAGGGAVRDGALAGGWSTGGGAVPGGGWSGAGGAVVCGAVTAGAWYPPPDRIGDPAAVERVLAGRLLGAAGDGLDPAVRARQRDRVADLLARARGLGLAGADVADYLYLTERVRRWPGAAAAPAPVLPLLAPTVVLAGFALPPGHARTHRLHAAVVARWVPEWVDVPHLPGGGPDRRVWRGDGAAVVRGLLGRPAGEGLAGLVRQAAVRRELACWQWRRPTADHATRQYVHLALSDELLCGTPAAAPRRDWVALDRIRGGLGLTAGGVRPPG